MGEFRSKGCRRGLASHLGDEESSPGQQNWRRSSRLNRPKNMLQLEKLVLQICDGG
ncbi:uncharacterized protein ASCRUDRAFT_79981 [Ascoidea rubescens DSM 1968]|uniref:Uncharacterized protein n=1 Tax=Ascoidea rubescens DSM 1968 TaxID=1344418 RepID=A0A1D2VLQ8_9ASCO|nr:hypothetical protein ASCRUDRAFT_79981 [Ascoidea rubescens DSM 1968]ODV62477.1 hypothetical protein ASCRUDRAFT_79981 [Ascoidea rubescens DSM 1968]